MSRNAISSRTKADQGPAKDRNRRSPTIHSRGWLFAIMAVVLTATWFTAVVSMPAVASASTTSFA